MACSKRVWPWPAVFLVLHARLCVCVCALFCLEAATSVILCLGPHTQALNGLRSESGKRKAARCLHARQITKEWPRENQYAVEEEKRPYAQMQSDAPTECLLRDSYNMQGMPELSKQSTH